MDRRRPATKKEIEAALEAAHNHRETAAAALGISRSTLNRRMRRLRITAPRSDAKLEPADLPVVKAWVEEGLPLVELAEKYEVHPSTLTRALRG